jgi:hypothetical protein
MVMSPVELGTKNSCDGEDLQHFTRAAAERCQPARTWSWKPFNCWKPLPGNVTENTSLCLRSVVPSCKNAR